MKIRSSEIKKGKTFRKVVYLNGVKCYAEIKVVKLYTYKLAHSRDLKKWGTLND